MGTSEPFGLESEGIGGLPILNHVLERMGLGETLARYLPATDARLRLHPAQAIGVVVRNVCLGREPLYGLGEWAGGYEPALIGLSAEGGGAGALNDDRVGRALARLFDADRASLLTELMLRVIAAFAIETSQLHNDSTSISFSGVYQGADGHRRGGKATPAICHGHNKDHRPDLKQLVWILTVSGDGAVPIAYRLADGNTSDDTTHVDTWDGLVALVGRADFLYVADCKLASRQAMGHIEKGGGRFVTVLPRSRKEDGFLREWIQTHAPAWQEAARHPGPRAHDPDEVWSVAPSPIPSAEGYRICWVHSSGKEARDAAARQGRIEAGLAALEEVSERVAGPRSRLRTRVAVEQAAEAALAASGATRWLRVAVSERVEESFCQERRGRPGADTRYRRHARTRFSLAVEVDREAVAYDARSDGCFPLITNDLALSEAELLAAYRYQPNLEKRHAQLKGVHLVAPVFLKDPARIEGLLVCYFIALLTHALIEREIRQAMTRRELAELALYPEERSCRAPTAARILELFAGVSRHRLTRDGKVIQVFEPTLTPLQLQVLDLLGVPPSAFHEQ